LQTVPAVIWRSTVTDETFESLDAHWCNILQPDADQHVLSSKCAYPLEIIHAEGNTYDADGILPVLKKIEDTHGISWAVGIAANAEDNAVISNFFANFIENVPRTIYQENEFINEQWKEADIFVVVDHGGFDESNERHDKAYELGLLAAQLAAYYNAPLLFIGQENMNDWQNDLKGKTLILIGDLHQSVLNNIKEYNLIWPLERVDEYNFEPRDLIYGEGRLKLAAGTNKNEQSDIENTFPNRQILQEFMTRQLPLKDIILINPLDIKDEYCESIPYKALVSTGHDLSKSFCGDSLASPWFAVGKDENIVFAPVGVSPGIGTVGGRDQLIRDQNADAIESHIQTYPLSNSKYLTVLASPKAIPLSGNIVSIPRAWEIRYSYDNEVYSRAFEDDYVDLIAGRIYTKSISGTSSYIVRDVFNLQSSNNDMLFLSPNQQFSNRIANVPPFNHQPSFKKNINPEQAQIDCFTDKWIFDNFDEVQQNQLCNPYPDAGIDNVLFENKKIIDFSDHGSPTNLGEGAIKFKDIPNLDSSLFLSNACSTNDYYQAVSPVYKPKLNVYVGGPTMLERGALAFFGSTGIAEANDHYKYRPMLVDEAVLRLISHNNYDIGSAIKDLNSELTPGLSDWILLGDPTVTFTIPDFSSSILEVASAGKYGVINTDDMQLPDEPKFAFNLFQGVEKELSFQISNLKNDISTINTLEAKVKNPRGEVSQLQDINCIPHEDGNSKLCTFTYLPEIDGRYFFTIKSVDTDGKVDYIFFQTSTLLAITVTHPQVDCEFLPQEFCISGQKNDVKFRVYHEGGIDKIDQTSVRFRIWRSEPNRGLFSEVTEYPDDIFTDNCEESDEKELECKKVDLVLPKGGDKESYVLIAKAKDINSIDAEEKRTNILVHSFHVSSIITNCEDDGDVIVCEPNQAMQPQVKIFHNAGVGKIDGAITTLGIPNSLPTFLGCENEDEHRKSCTFNSLAPEAEGTYKIKATAFDTDGNEAELLRDLIVGMIEFLSISIECQPNSNNPGTCEAGSNAILETTMKYPGRGVDKIGDVNLQAKSISPVPSNPGFTGVLTNAMDCEDLDSITKRCTIDVVVPQKLTNNPTEQFNFKLTATDTDFSNLQWTTHLIKTVT